MKILITHEIFPPEKTGGGEDLMQKLAEDLIARGHDVEVFTGGNPEIKNFGSIRTHRFKANRYLMNFFARQIEVAAKDFDLIQTSSGNLCIPSWLAAKKLRKPVICLIHHAFGKYWRDVRGPALGIIFEAAERFFLSRDFDYVIVQNKSTEKLLRQINKKSKIVFLPSGISSFADLKPKRKERYVFFPGTHNMTKEILRVKGFNCLLDAAKKLPEIKFLAAGGGYSDEIKKSAPQNVEFVGHKTGKTFFELYNRALVYCLPSLAEGFSRTTSEAMAAGCAIVSTIDLDQEGKIIEPKNAGQIAERIKFYFENPKIAIAEGRKNSIIAKKYSWKKFIYGMEKIYFSALKQPHKS